jgi:hypothetical protein
MCMKRSFVFLSLCPESRNERSREEKLHTSFVLPTRLAMVKESLL